MLHVTSGLAADYVLARAYHTLKMAYSTIIDSICSNTLTVSLSRLDLVGKRESTVALCRSDQMHGCWR